MASSISPQTSKNDLTPHWVVVAIILILLLGYLIACLFMAERFQLSLSEEQRIWIRTLCYIVAIVLFPFTNLIRHMQLRLNQTLPGSKSAGQRYLLTVMVSMTLIHGVGVLGLVMFLLGDDFNTLYILLCLGVLGVYLYRPKYHEYISIVEAIDEK